MFSKSQLMHKAWEFYRDIHARYAQWQFDCGIHDGSFSNAFKTAWRIMTAQAAEATRKAAEMANRQVRALRAAIDNLQYKGFAHNIRRERAALEG